MDLKKLTDFFPESEIEWKPIAVSKKTGKALVAAYITNRAIMDRLDEVCGPVNWKNEFQPGPDGGVICGISIRVPPPDPTSGWWEGQHEWVTKWDGSENTDIEAIKGGLSTAMRRAAVQWGIGRYLYDLPSQWVPVDEYGHFTRTPTIPKEFLPAKADRPANGKVTSPASLPADMSKVVIELLVEAEAAGIPEKAVLQVAGTEYGHTRLDELTDDQAQALLARLKAKTSHG